MARSPFDLNRDGRWSTSERAFTWMAARELRRDDEGRRVGCGCLALPVLALLALIVGLARCSS